MDLTFRSELRQSCQGALKMSLQPDLSIKIRATGFALELLLLKIEKSQMDELASIQKLKDQEHEQTGESFWAKFAFKWLLFLEEEEEWN